MKQFWYNNKVLSEASDAIVEAINNGGITSKQMDDFMTDMEHFQKELEEKELNDNAEYDEEKLSYE